MTETAMSQEAAEQLLAPHLDAIRDAVQGGWGDWLEWQQQKVSTARIRTTTRANAVYDFVTERMEAYFDGVEGVTTNRRNQYLQVVFPGDQIVVLRFKKFRNRQLRTSGIPTEHRLAVEAQAATFEGLEATYITAGYLPDAAGTALERVAITCTYYDQLLWAFDLEPEELVVPEPMREVEPEAPAVRSTRPAAKKKTSEEQ